MQEPSDIELLRQYADQNSEAAFETLVSRYVNLVYSAALRKTENAHAAEEVSQAVFIILAQKAHILRKEIILSGWLYQAARLTAANFLRSEIRRARREQEADMQSCPNEPEIWPQIVPLLEDAMGRLNEKERNALLLRFFEGKSFYEIGAACGGSENAAKKRVGYALEKLRKFFAGRGVQSTTDAIAGAISANSLQAAPVDLTKAISAVAKGAAASASTLTLTKGALKLMAWTKTKTMITGAAMALLIGGGVVIVAIQTIHAVRRALAPDIQGIWEGVDGQAATLSAVQDLGGSQGTQTHVVLKIFKTNGVYRATTDWPELGKKDVPMADVVYDYPNLEIHANVRDTWQLKVNEHARQMLWDHYINFIQPDPIRFTRTTASTPVPEPLTESDFAPRPGSALQGYWEGKIGTGPDAVPVDLKIAEQADGTFLAEGDDPMGGIQGRPVIVSYKPPAVEFRLADGTGMFRGQMNDSGTEISGHYLKDGQSLPASIRRGDYQAVQVQQALEDFSYTSRDDLQGHWKGTWIVTIGKVKAPIRMAIDIAKQPDGSYSAAIASVDQFGADAPVPASKFEYSAPNLHVECKWQGWGYDGKLENGKITGTWSQGGGGFSLVFERQN